MQVNAIISLVKSNSFEEAKSLLVKTMKQPQFVDQPKFASIFTTLQVLFLIKEKKIDEALKIVTGKDVYSVLLKVQLLLDAKRQKECVTTLIDYLRTNPGSNQLTPLLFRLANNYKLLDLPEF